MDLIDICVLCSVGQETISELDGAGIYVVFESSVRFSFQPYFSLAEP